MSLVKNEEYKGMGTTIEVLALVDNAVIFAHVGDSRIALIRNGEYKQLTSVITPWSMLLSRLVS